MQKMINSLRKVNKKENPRRRVTKPGFTLVEILIVVAVIGILFVTLVPRIDFAGDKARETGVKTNFRSFELAAEQLLRENAGISKHDTLAKLCATNGGLNLYLDAGLKFDTSGVSASLDPWNQAYSVQVVKPTGTGVNANNGGIIFISNGKDSLLSTDTDNYASATVFIDGVIESETSGFSSNIECASIEAIEANATAAAMTLTSGKASLKYKK